MIHAIANRGNLRGEFVAQNERTRGYKRAARTVLEVMQVRTANAGAADAPVTFTESFGDDYQPNHYVVLGAKDSGTGGVTLRIQLNGSTLQDLTMVRDGNRVRTMTNRRVSDGKLVVRNGAVWGSGSKTPWLTRCGDRN